jgi:hypothetical protein
LRPGGIIDSDDEKGIQMIQYPPAITDAFEEVAQSDARSQRRTGANEFVTQGSAPGTGQIGRTSAGVNTLAAGVGARIGYFVDFICNLYFIPALEAFHQMNSNWLDEDQINEILTSKLGEEYKGDALDVKNARLKFRMLAGAKIRARQQRAQSLPMMTQFLSSPQVQEWLQDTDQKLNVAEVVQQWFDVTETPGRQTIIQPMTEDDKKKQAMKNEFKQQMALGERKHQQTMEQIEGKGIAQAGTKVIGELAKHVSPEAAQAALDSQRQHTQAMTGLNIDQQVANQPEPPSAGGA